MESLPTDTTRAVNGPGPSWTNAEDWESGFDAYTRQRRSDDDIRSVVADPDKRGAGYTREKKLAYARERGYAARAEHVEPDVGAQALAPAAAGVPDARLDAFGTDMSLSRHTAGQPPKPHRTPQGEHRAHQTTPRSPSTPITASGSGCGTQQDVRLNAAIAATHEDAAVGR